jgi:hypothetical protein
VYPDEVIARHQRGATEDDKPGDSTHGKPWIMHEKWGDGGATHQEALAKRVAPLVPRVKEGATCPEAAGGGGESSQRVRPVPRPTAPTAKKAVDRCPDRLAALALS